jgi:transcriptional regulator with XRE-family HTH domain
MAQSSQQQNGATPTALVAARVRELRDGRGWSAQRLADELTQVGINWDRSIVANLESGRRATVSVEELLALAYVFGVAPVHILVPTDDRPYPVVPTDERPTRQVRAWIRGKEALKDERTYFIEVPADEWVATTGIVRDPTGIALVAQEMARLQQQLLTMVRQQKEDNDGTR